MTNQEAITKLTNIMHDDHYSWHPSILEAFRMAVDALRGADGDCISRQAAIDAFLTELTKRERKNLLHTWSTVEVKYFVVDMLEKLPSAQPEPLSDAYTKAVWTWLLDYQIKATELKGKYTPCEVLSWVANDWRKEHERSD